MKEYIEKIIEIFLENVSCDHQEIEEFPHGPKFDDPTYCLNDENAVIEKCLAVIPEANIEELEEWIEEKAKELCEQNYVNDEAKDFIRSLVNELLDKINFKGKRNEEEKISPRERK